MSLKQDNKDNKLSPMYHVPYKVLQNIGTMAYKLELPASSRVCQVFHVSCLEKVISDKLRVQTILPELDEEGKGTWNKKVRKSVYYYVYLCTNSCVFMVV